MKKSDKVCVTDGSTEKLAKIVDYLRANPNMVSAYFVGYFPIDGEFRVFIDGYLNEILMGSSVMQQRIILEAVGAARDISGETEGDDVAEDD